MSLNSTPRSNRLHIGIFGNRNVGKSSLINALTGQQISLVSDTPGTTTDPVYKSFELAGFGPVVFVDTAGFDDEGEIGALRISRTEQAVQKCDIALLLFDAAPTALHDRWSDILKEKKIPILAVVTKSTKLNVELLSGDIRARYGFEVLSVDSAAGSGIDALRKKIAAMAPDDFWDISIVGDLAGENDTVLLVMPQDIQAPKGRLILPQVQTTRELLDKKCVVISCTADKMQQALDSLANPPHLIITDSQVFDLVYPLKPKESLLTSFSVLFAGYKGDIKEFMEGAKAIYSLKETSRVLVAEACAHAPAEEDIGRVKIPNLMAKKLGFRPQIEFVRGNDFPKDLSGYDLIIHCGACMFSRKHVLNRMQAAKDAGVPICNYGIVLASLNGILDKIVTA